MTIEHYQPPRPKSPEQQIAEDTERIDKQGEEQILEGEQPG